MSRQGCNGSGSIEKTERREDALFGRGHAAPISAAAFWTARVDLSVAMGGSEELRLQPGGNPLMALVVDRSVAMAVGERRLHPGLAAAGLSGPGSVSRPDWNALRSVSS